MKRIFLILMAFNAIELLAALPALEQEKIAQAIRRRTNSDYQSCVRQLHLCARGVVNLVDFESCLPSNLQTMTNAKREYYKAIITKFCTEQFVREQLKHYQNDVRTCRFDSIVIPSAENFKNHVFRRSTYKNFLTTLSKEKRNYIKIHGIHSSDPDLQAFWAFGRPSKPTLYYIILAQDLILDLLDEMEITNANLKLKKIL